MITQSLMSVETDCLHVTLTVKQTPSSDHRGFFAQVAVLAGCWLPYMGCALCVELCPSSDVQIARAVLPYCLLLGHAHSAISPAIYWLLNRQSLQLPSCTGSEHRQLSGKLRFFRLPHFNRNTAAAAPSSTNEAALGPFHPRYVNFRQPQSQRFHTSHFLQ